MSVSNFRSNIGAVPGDSRPEIEIGVGEIERAVNEAEAALIEAQAAAPVEKKIFRRGDRLVSLAVDKGKDHRGQGVENQIIVELGAYALAERLAAAAVFLKFDGRTRKLKKIDRQPTSSGQ